jgi:acetylornithine/N-succinyldiaminopimelate aminotransferase
MQNIIWSTGHTLKFNNIVKAQNCQVWDADGNCYTDLESGVWCTNLGHNHPKINAIIHSQIDQLTHTGFCYCHPVLEQAASKVLEITHLPGGKCEFLTSGSEAVEYGMRVARQIAEKPLALTFSDSYFGAYGDAATRSTDKWYVYNRLECSCKHPEGCVGECDEFQQIPFQQIGIFLIEPGSSSGMVRFPSKQLIEKIGQIIRENDGLIMSNEITTGIGRTGKWFGYQHYDIQPDIVAMGKGIGNGFPASVTAISKDVAQRLSDTSFLYAQSHQNDPLGASVIQGVIETIQAENLIERGREMGLYLMAGLEALRQKHPLIKSVRGRGMMMVIEFTAHSMQVYEQLLSAGFIVAKRSNAEVLRIDPALTIEKEQVDAFIGALDGILGIFWSIS